MRRSLLGVLAVFATTAAVAQPPGTPLPQPRISSVFPMGLRQGTAVEVTVTGTDLDDAAGLTFSHPGFKATVVVPPEPKVDPKAKADPKVVKPNPKKGPPPTSVKFEVTADKSVPAGRYDLRVVNAFGVSNPRLFTVGVLPEVNEVEPNEEATNLSYPAAVTGAASLAVPPKAVPHAQRVALGTTVNGILASATDVDYSVFFGKAGQRVLAHCATSSIDSRARPMVELFDAAGVRLAQNRNAVENDALADATLTADGDYYVRVTEFAYQQGGPDYFYRLTLSAGPWIDAVFPPVVNPGTTTPVTVYGRNLPGGKVVPGLTLDGKPVEAVTTTVTAPADGAALTFRGRVASLSGVQDGFEFRLPAALDPAGLSNAVVVFLSPAKVVLEGAAKHASPETAEAIPVPCDIVGRIDRRYDRDFYKFAAKKGDVYILEAVAERLGSDADLSLRLRDEAGKELAGELDDDPDTLSPTSFYTRNGDPPAFKFTAPADGTYTVLVSSIDSNVNFGPRCFYRLRVSVPAPDFRVVAMARSRELPATVLALADGETAFDVFVSRRDGFSGPVTVTATGLPAGVTAAPVTVGGTSRYGTLVVSAAGKLADAATPVTVTATATIDGKPVSRVARPASIVWGVPGQQNTPTITRLDQQLLLVTRGTKSQLRLTTDLAGVVVKTKGKDGKDLDEKPTGPIFLKPGDKLTLPLKVLWQGEGPRENPVTIVAEATQAVANNNSGVTLNNGQPLTVAKDKAEAAVTLDVKPTTPPGLYTVSLRGETAVNFLRDPTQKDKKTVAAVAAYAPPLSVTVLPVALVKVTVTAPAGGIKAGATGEVTVRVERLNDFAGELKVNVALPKDTKGVTVADGVIAAKADEVKLLVTVANDYKPGGLPNLPVTVTGTVHDKFPLVAESKVTLTVTAAAK